MSEPATHYRQYAYSGLKFDPYRVAAIYGITHPAHQHALKKLLRAGRGPHKEVHQEITEIKQTLDRWLEMLNEDVGRERAL